MDDYVFHRKIDGIDFYAPSKLKGKKYDAYVNGKRFSFGSLDYQHFIDRIGYYESLNHYDKKRRDSYRSRHRNDKLDEISSGYLSWHYLW